MKPKCLLGRDIVTGAMLKATLAVLTRPVRWSLFVVVLFVLAACAPVGGAPEGAAGAPPSSPSAPTTKAEIQRRGDGAADRVTPKVLRLHGSNTLGLSLVPRLARGFLEKKGATDVVVNNDGRERQHVWVQARWPGHEVSIEIHSPGTKVGFESLENGVCDIALASRPISATEAERLKRLGDLTAPASETVIAMDGIAVIVHPNNPVTRLTVAQLESIFAGEVTSWSGLGGRNVPVRVLALDAKSGTHDAFTSLVMQRRRELKAAELFEDSEALSRAVLDDEGAIGFVGLPYVRQAKVLAVLDGGSLPLFPTPFTVATEDYPLSRRLFLYAPPNPTEPMVQDFIEFALSDEGQALVGEAGFVPLSLKAEATHAPAGAPAKYSKLAAGATRLSVNFRFKLGSAALDTKALRDMDRLVTYLAAQTNRGRHVTLAGFADRQGKEPLNVALSKQRADAVAALLAQRGITPEEIDGFGSALPVAPNDSPEGRSRNRRVEVWVH